MPSLDTPNFRAGDQPSASRLEETDHLARNVYGIGGTRVVIRNGRIGIDGGGALNTWTFFGYRFVAGTNTLQVKARAVVFHSSGLTANIAESDVLLSGAAAWVYAQVNRTTGATSVLCGSARPASDPESYLNVVLYRFDLSGTRYVLGHCGWWDTNIDLPLVKGT
jgi:hypothetical protein